MITTLTSSGECNSCSSSLCSCVQYPFTPAGPSGRAVKGVGLRPLACWDSCFESHLEHGCLSLVSVVCCYVENPASGWSLVQMSPTLCGVPECDRDASIMRRPWPSRDCCAMGKSFTSFFLGPHVFSIHCPWTASAYVLSLCERLSLKPVTTE
jgi:hypothetical protein